MPALVSPLNLKVWIDEHRHHLKPPIGHRRVFEEGGFIVMVTGGPSHRKDFHINPTEELFFQVEGDIIIRIIDDQARMRDIPVREGELFLLPPNVPHSPQMPAGSVGLVVERQRSRGEDDVIRFYCDKCEGVVHEEQFEAGNLLESLKDVMNGFWSDATLRTCMACGTVVQPPSAPAPPVPKDLQFPRDLSTASTPRARTSGSARKVIAARPTAAPSPTTKKPALARPAISRPPVASGKKKVASRPGPNR
jgi:3-hydroxyanthranilate 3,4-dioxygenase